MNLNCSNQDPCPVILDSKCVIYEGENLLYIGVNTNDNFRFALEQINTTIGNLILSGGITQLTGDVVAYGPGTAIATLATVNSNVGQFGSSTAIPKITVNGKGLITAISTESVLIPSGSLNFIGDVTGSGNTGSDTTLTLATVNSNVYGSNTFLKFTVNGKGLVTAATPVVSGDITAALGYTPYNSTNPSNFISRLGLTASTPLAYNNTTGNFTIQQSSGSQDGYLSSTDWNTFNNKQTSGNYITDLNGEATATGPGVASVTLNNSAVTGKVLTGLNIIGGSITAADTIIKAFGKVQNQINGLIGGSIYQGVWDASTNTPTLTSGVGTKGYYYIVNVAGSTNLDGITDWGLGDWAIFDGTAWQQVDNTDAVVSVNGFTGAVSLSTDNISEGLTNQYFTTSRARLSLSAGTGISYDNVTGVITNSAPDQTVSLSSGAGINVTGSYPSFTVASTITQYTDALARAAISGGTGISYSSSTGIISSTITQYTDALARQAISLTTTGTSGAATYDNITGILNVPNYGGSLTGYVPYTGATADVDLGTYGLTSDYLQLNTSPTSVPTTAGTMSWNDSYGTMDIKLKGGNVTLQTGQENVVRVVNKAGTNLLEANYQAVRVRTTAEGGAQGQRLAVVLAQADSDLDSATTIGLVTETINNNQEGFITVFGNVSDINTTGSLQGETWIDGDIIYLSPTTAGALTNVKPVAPQHLITIGYVVYAHSQHGIIFVKVDNGYELEELHNVYAPTASKVNNDVLTWNAATNLWINQSIVSNLGYTPVSGTGTTNYIPKFTGSTAIGNSLIYDNGTNVGIGTTSPSTIGGYRVLSMLGGAGSILELKAGSGATSLIYSNNVGLNLTAQGSLDMLFLIDFVEKARLNNNGTFSIGNTNNTYKLDVSGTGRFTGQLRLDSTITNGTYTYTLPSSTGTLALTSDIPSLAGYVPTSRTLTINGTTYDLSADRSWTVTPNINATYTQDYTATAGQTVFTVTGGYTVGQLAVYYNGSKLAAAEYTATDGSTFTLATACQVNDIVQAVSSVTGGGIGGSGTTNYLSKFTASGVIGNSTIWDNGTNVGIGNTNTTYKLDVTGTARTTGTIYAQGSGGQIQIGGVGTGVLSGMFQGSNSNYLFIGDWNTATKGITIDVGNGNVGIGTSSPDEKLVVNGPVVVTSYLQANRTSSGVMDFYSGSTRIFSYGSGGTNGNILFYRGTDGGSANESMRITNGGNVLIGTTTNASNYQFVVNSTAYVKQLIAFGVNDEGRYLGQGNQISGAFQSYDLSLVNYAPSARITITNSTTGVYLPNGSTSWSTFSDERLKNINSNIENAVEKLSNIRAVDYSWKSDETQKHNLGLIAQDVEKVFPQVIDKAKSFSETDDTEYLSVKYTELIPVLVAAIQELEARLKTLENK